MVSKTMTKTKDAVKVQVNNRTSTAHNVQSRLPELFGSNHRQGGKRHRKTERYPVIRGDFCSIGLWSLVVVVLTGLFVFQSPQNSYARVVSPSGVPVSTGNPVALPRGVGGYGHNPLVDYQNPYAPQVKGQVGPALNQRASQLLDQHLPQTAQTGLQEMTDRLVKSADSLFGPDPRTYKSPFVTGGEDNGRDWSNGTRYGPSRLPGVPNPARTRLSDAPPGSGSKKIKITEKDLGLPGASTFSADMIITENCNVTVTIGLVMNYTGENVNFAGIMRQLKEIAIQNGGKGQVELKADIINPKLAKTLGKRYPGSITVDPISELLEEPVFNFKTTLPLQP
jgi:hypothetical protein